MESKNIRVYILKKLAGILLGKNGEIIVDTLAEKGEVKDDELSRAVGMNENEVRRILWKLSDYTIVSTRKVINSETGWITYYWYLPLDQAPGILYNVINRIIDRLECRLEYEKNNIFFWCGNVNCPKYTFDEATELIFRCKRCGKALKPYDNSRLIEALNWMIKELKKFASRVMSI